jgi:uncharacterized LabA/DUF88 family protein
MVANRQTYIFIDASNLFYGGEKSLGWSIDYKKLYKYLRQKYEAKRIYYFGGVEVHDFPFDYLLNDTVPLKELKNHLLHNVIEKDEKLNEADLALISRHLDIINFYLKLESFGYQLVLKPVKNYMQDDGNIKRKANCDVDMAFFMMKYMTGYDRAVVLSGDGDFLPLLKHLKSVGKEVIVLARGKRTAREIKIFTGSNFRDFVRLEKHIRYK